MGASAAGYAAEADGVQLAAVDGKAQQLEVPPAWNPSSAAAADSSRQPPVPPYVEAQPEDGVPERTATGGVTAVPVADVVPLAMGDGMLAIGGFEELLTAPSPSPPPAVEENKQDVPLQAHAGDGQAALNSAPVSTEVPAEAQEETAAAVAEEMTHKS